MEINNEGSKAKVQYTCQTCFVSFTRDGYLRNHIQKCHTEKISNEPDKIYDETVELFGRGKRRKTSTSILTRGVESPSKTLLDTTKAEIDEKKNSEALKSPQSSCKRLVGRPKKIRVPKNAEKTQPLESRESGTQDEPSITVSNSTSTVENLLNECSTVDAIDSNDVSNNGVNNALNERSATDNIIGSNEISNNSVGEKLLNTYNQNTAMTSVKRKRGRPSKELVSLSENLNMSKELVSLSENLNISKESEISNNSVGEKLLNTNNQNAAMTSVKRKRGRPSKESETGNTILTSYSEMLTTGRRKKSLTVGDDQFSFDDRAVNKRSSKQKHCKVDSEIKKFEETVAVSSSGVLTEQISDNSDEDAVNSILNVKEKGSDKIEGNGKVLRSRFSLRFQVLRSRFSRASQVGENIDSLKDDDGGETSEVEVELEPRKRGRPKKGIVKKKIADNEIPDELKEGSDSGEEEGSNSKPQKRGRPKKGVRRSELTENDSDVGEEEEDSTNCKPRKARGRKAHVIFEFSEFADEILSRKRGRPKNSVYQQIMKNNNSLDPKKVEKVTCACLREFPSFKEFRVHNLRVHLGLFRKLGDKKPFTKFEKRMALKDAIKLLKKLKCLNHPCDKSFSTVLGYIYHENVCGLEKEQRMVACDLCGKTLLESSLHTHKKVQHDTTKVIMKIEEIDPSQKRLAAKKAVEKLALIADDVKLDKRDALDADFEFQSDEENLDDLELPEEKSGRSSRKASAPIPHDEVVLKEIWLKDINLKGSAYCRNEGCIHKENELEKILDHFYRCSFRQYDIYECKICEVRRERKELVSDHLIREHSEEVQKGSSTDYSDFMRKFSPQAKCPTYKVDKRNRKVNQQFNAFLRNTFIQHITQAKEFVQTNLSNGIEFPEWLPFVSHWAQVPKREMKLFLPKIKCSSGFKCQKSYNVSKDCDWKKLKLFESIGSSDEQKFKMCFVGGPVKACAWCPTTLQTSSVQYLALYCHNDPDVIITNKEICNNSCLIQIWNVGELEQKDNSPGKLVLAIADECGAVWDLSWCPSGCWNIGENADTSSDSNSMPRIGLLSAACADGFVKLYSIPCPSSLKFDSEIPMYKVKPTAVLVLNPNINSYSRVQCTTLSWCQGKGHEFIAGGYANGLIAVWNLKSKSLLTMIEKENGDRFIVSHLCFRGHGNIVTGLDFSHLYLGKYLASCSRDRSVKFWNLENVSLPINIIKNRAVSKVKWHPFWCGVFLVSDNCYSLNYNGMVYVDVNFLGELGGSATSHPSSINDLSISLWMKCLASCDEAGEVSLSVFSDVKSVHLGSNYKQRILFSVSLKDGEDSECEVKNEESMSLKSITEQFRYEDAARRFKTIYTDHSISNQKLPMSKAMMNTYPLNSVNKVVWNPNLGPHYWLASGDQFGMLRLYNASSVDLVPVDKIRQDLKT